MMTPVIEKLKKKQPYQEQFWSCPHVRRPCFDCRRMGFLRKALSPLRHGDVMKESEPGSWNTGPVLPLFSSLDVLLQQSLFCWVIFYFLFFLANTHKALTYIILIVSNWMKFMKPLAQSVHCLHWDNWSVRNICLLKTTQEGPEHPARPGPQGLPPSGQLCPDALHSKGAFPATLISPRGGALAQESEDLLSHVNFTIHLLYDLNSG